MRTHKFSPLIIVVLALSLGLCSLGVFKHMEKRLQTTLSSTVDKQLQAYQDEDLTVIAVGDIACAPYDEGYNKGEGIGEECRHKAVADAIKKEKHIDALILLGDIQYQKGELENFKQSLLPSWSGIQADAVLAVPGNHDWANGNIDPYIQIMPVVFPTIVRTTMEKPYFVWKKNSWRIFGLDSDCFKIGGCATTDTQITWLKTTLAETRSRCTLAFWHHPVFNSGQHRIDGTNAYMRNAFRILDQSKADLVLAGHEHVYERFYPQSLAANDGPGVREINVGTGGRNLYNFVLPYETGHEVGVRDFGYLKLHLKHAGYSWEFIDINGNVRDNGKSVCH